MKFSPQDLGLNILTSESCAYSMRLLVDLNPEGVTLIRSFFGLPYDSHFDPNWNHGSVASIMLPREMIQSLMIYALFHVHHYEYVRTNYGDNTLTGFHPTDEYATSYIEAHARNEPWLGDAKLFRNPAVESTDGRNQHQATGRIS